MTAKKLTELNEILADVRALREKIDSLEVRPNWESKVKADMFSAIHLLDLSVSDFIVSAESD